MDVLEELMSKRKWEKRCLRANVAQPEDIVTCGTVKAAKIYSNVLNKKSKEPVLYDAIKEAAPEWWDEDTQITLNKDLMCKRHKDHGNKEHSWILWLGDFTEGALNFDDGTKVEGKRQWHKINGQIHHWNDPHEGSKYSVVLYTGTRKPKARTIAASVRAKREREKNLQI